MQQPIHLKGPTRPVSADRDGNSLPRNLNTIDGREALDEEKYDYKEETVDGVLHRRWKTSDGREVLAIDTVSPNELAKLKAMGQRHHIPGEVEEAPKVNIAQPTRATAEYTDPSPNKPDAKNVVNENPTDVGQVYANPFSENLNLWRSSLYRDFLGETEELKKREELMNKVKMVPTERTNTPEYDRLKKASNTTGRTGEDLDILLPISDARVKQ